MKTHDGCKQYSIILVNRKAVILNCLIFVLKLGAGRTGLRMEVSAGSDGRVEGAAGKAMGAWNLPERGVI